MKYFLYARKSTEDKARQVQSIPDQLRILTELAKQRGLQIIETITDIKSAKAPGRIGFTNMMQRIQAGEADGILCWKIDRLSRNSVDGGTLMWMLQNSNIREIITPERTYYPQDNTLLLSVEFGLATQMIRDLSTNVKRGMRSKIENGWLPTVAPIGYLNEKQGIKGQKRIFPDPTYFPIIKGLWLYLLQNRCSMMQLYTYMQSECPIFLNGKIMAFSSFHRLFQNKFYCGLFQWKGETYTGAHEPMITLSQFEEAQTYLFQKHGIRERNLQFDLKGEFRCGTCGALITAEQHKKYVKAAKEEKIYRFYRCHRRKSGVKCHEKPLSEPKLEAQILEYISNLQLPDEIIQFGVKTLDSMQSQSEETIAEKQLKRELCDIAAKIEIVENNVAEERDSDARTVMMRRLNQLKVIQRKLAEDQEAAKAKRMNQNVEIRNSLDLIHNAKRVFVSGTKDQKRAILRGIGSNWKLSAKQLSCEPNFVAAALEKTKQLHSADIVAFEPEKTQVETTKNPTCELTTTIWSGRRESNPCHQVGNLR